MTDMRTRSLFALAALAALGCSTPETVDLAPPPAAEDVLSSLGLFKDAAKQDFRLQPGSPANTLGFKPINLSTVGVRAKSARP